MDRETFIELMEHLERERISRIERFRKLHPLEFGHILQIISEMAPGYMRYSRDLRSENSHDQDIEYVASVLRALRMSNDMAEEIGMTDVVDEFHELIISGMEIDDIPKHDIEALEQLGERSPKGALLAAFWKVKHRGSLSQGNFNEIDINGRLQKLERKLADVEEQRQIPTARKADDDRKPKRRWFKGLGKVAQGTALTLADVGLAAGVLVLPVDPTTQTWGAIVSSVTGIGTALDGAGELRGE